MHKLYHLLLRSAIVLCMLGAFATTTTAQEKVEITEGREFYFGIPQCRKPTGEGARGTPIQLWVGSKVNTTVTVEAPALGFAQTHAIKAGTVKIIAIPEGLMNHDGEKKMPYGIHVTAQDPVTVTCYISYKVSGEAFAVPAVETAGKRYYAMSLYQDQTDEYKPGQILIVATKNDTKVSYIPTADTEKIKAKRVGTVTLQKGDTYLIRSKIQPAFNQDVPTDLTGTYIEASKPVMVFSGHTKGAFPRFSNTMLNIPANFMRNMYMDHVHAVEFLGTEYVVAPIQYTNRPYNGQDPDGQGDKITFIATQDGTDLSIIKSDGVPKIIKSGMMKGEVYDIVTFMEAAVYTANKPIAAAQYGKAWRVSVVSPITNPDNDDSRTDVKKEKVANPSRNGEGMMFSLTPESQWASYAIFRSPAGMNNFINITFRTVNAESIKFNGKYIRAVFGSKVREIPGTPYSYVAAINAEGEHRIEADSGSKDVKFAAYVYGNFDATKDGFAYGYPVGVNYALNMKSDSIKVTDQIECGNVTGQVEIIHSTDEYAGLFDIRMDAAKSSNYKFSTTPSPVEVGSDKAEYALLVVDPMQDAHGVVYILDRTGKQITRTYDYVAEKVVADPTSVKFGPLAVGAEECKQITLTNPTSKDFDLKGLELKTGRMEFTIKSPATFPVTIPAGKSITIDVCGKAYAAGTVEDSIRAILSCYKPMIAELKLVAGEPKVTMNDLPFGAVPVGKSKTMEVVIENVSDGDVQVELNTVDWADKTHFTTTGLLDKLPIILPKRGSTFKFSVTYTPTDAGNQNKTTAQFTGNTTVIKTFSDWTGIGIDAGPYIIGYNWGDQRMNPSTPYPYSDGTFGITGNSAFTIERIEITAGDKAAFTFDEALFNKDYKGKTFQPGWSFNKLPYTFNPTEERAYDATITIFGKDLAGTEKVAFDKLLGVGIQPHGEGDLYDFGRHLTTAPKVAGTVYAHAKPGKVAMLISFNPTTPFTAGSDAAYFSIDETKFDLTKTYEVAAGDSLAIPVFFTPTVLGSFQAKIAHTEDAAEDFELVVIAETYTEGTPDAKATGYEFQPIFTFTNSDDATYNGSVQTATLKVENTGTVDGTITSWDLEADKDYANFVAPNVVSIPLPVGTNKVDIPGFVFVNPTTVRNDFRTTVNITVTFNDQTKKVLQADIVAKSKELPIVVSIPKGYVVDAGRYTRIDYNIRNKNAAEPLTKAKMTKFHVVVDYDKSVIRAEGQTGRLADAIEMKDGTLLDANKGWKVNHIELLPGANGREQMSIEFLNDGSNPLVLDNTNDQVLFRFWTRSYLAMSKTTTLECDILPVDRAFVVTENIPGDLKINEFCVDESRAIKKRASFALGTVAPNPVKDQTEITYSVAFDIQTRLVVVNSLGEEVAVLVNGVQEPGTYTVSFDASRLAAGTYFYRITAGPYSETKTMNIVK